MRRFRPFEIVVSFIAAVAMFLVSAPCVFAATLSSVSDIASTLQVGQAANHQFTFTTSTGAGVASNIQFTFGSAPSQFGVTTSASDVGVTVNAVVKTVGATCASTNYSAVIASNVVTLTVCGTGAIAPASAVVVTIGNATVTNPSSVGTHYVTISGTFGDSGSIALPIGGADQVSVSASYTHITSPPPPPPPPPPPSIAPVISGITVSTITTTSAVIGWTTDKSATSQVDYGVTDAYELGSVYDAASISSHSLSITGLSSGVTYHFKITSVSVDNGSASSVDQTFMTLDVIPPVISTITVTNIGQNTATITWTTDEPATSTVDFGLSDAYGTTVTDAALVTSHSLGLTQLTFGTTYHFRVRSSDASLNEATSADGTFDTLQNPPPGNVSGLSAALGDRQNILTWANPSDEDLVGIRVVVCTSGYPIGPVDARTGCSIAFDAAGTTFAHTGLANGTTYYYGVYPKDTAGQFATGALVSSRPNATPGNVSNFAIVRGNQQLTITWRNPSDTDLSAVRIVACTDGYPIGPMNTSNGCAIVSESLDTSFVYAGLSNGTTYYFGAYAKDASGLFASGITGAGTPAVTKVNPPPGPVSNVVAISGDGQVVLRWDNPSDADLGSIRVLACTRTHPSSLDDTDGCTVISNAFITTFDHTGLANGSSVFYGIYARDNAGQYSTGSFATGTPSAANAVCGDGTCNGQETPLMCPLDCGSTAPICGNGACDVGETTQSCPADCGLIPSCGNGVCDSDETSASCPADCPVVPPTTVPESRQLTLTDVRATVDGVDLSLRGQTFDFLPGSSITFNIVTDQLPEQPEQVRIAIGSQAYSLILRTNPDGTSTYVADVPLPTTSGSFATAVVVQFKDGTAQSLPFVSNVQDIGLVYEVVNGASVPVSGTIVTLLEGSFFPQAWDGTPFKEENPHLTGTNGTFGWYVPTGTYRIRVEKAGYDTVTTKSFSADNHLAVASIRIKVSQPFIPAVITAVQDLQASPVAQQAADTTTATIVAVAVANTATLAVGFNLIGYLQYITTAPILLFSRRKRKGYGVVYNAITKLPVDLAIVRLYRVDPANPTAMGQLVASRVTDKGGRYFFLAQPGTYRVAAVKPGFGYPTSYLASVKDDGLFLDVYHNEPIQVTGTSVSITPNIPLDPVAGGQTPASIKWKAGLRRLQGIVAAVGNIGAVAVLIIRPSVTTAVMAGGQLAVYALVRRLSRPHKPVNWGIVYDKRNGRPLANVVARIFEPKYNKLLETAITDNKGRFTFLLGPNEYYAIFEHEGFAPYTLKPIDYSKRAEPSDLAEKIGLEPVSTIVQPPPSIPAPPLPPPPAPIMPLPPPLAAS